MNVADMESCKRSIRLMQHALNNQIQEAERHGFDVIDVRRHLENWPGSAASGPVFRSRLISEKRLSKMEGTVSINEFRYPPESAAIENKCNAYGQPVTYCSSDFLGAVIETIFSKGPEIRPGYHFFVSEWIIKNTPVKVFNTHDRLRNDNLHSPDERDLINEYLETLEKCFINRQGYAFTSQFAQNLLFGSREKGLINDFDIISYPSCVRAQDGPRDTGEDWNNYAIVPSFFDKYQFHRVYLIKTPTMKEVIAGGIHGLQFLLVGYPDPDRPGIVRWKQPEKSEMPQITSRRKQSSWSRLFNLGSGEVGKN